MVFEVKMRRNAKPSLIDMERALVKAKAEYDTYHKIFMLLSQVTDNQLCKLMKLASEVAVLKYDIENAKFKEIVNDIPIIQRIIEKTLNNLTPKGGSNGSS